MISLKLQVAEPLLPYALAFAAGAMIYVVVDDIIPEAQTRFDIPVIFTVVFTNHDCNFDFIILLYSNAVRLYLILELFLVLSVRCSLFINYSSFNQNCSENRQTKLQR